MSESLDERRDKFWYRELLVGLPVVVGGGIEILARSVSTMVVSMSAYRALRLEEEDAAEDRTWPDDCDRTDSREVVLEMGLKPGSRVLAIMPHSASTAVQRGGNCSNNASQCRSRSNPIKCSESQCSWMSRMKLRNCCRMAKTRCALRLIVPAPCRFSLIANLI